MIDPRPRLLGDDRLGVERDSQPGCSDHIQIIGPVTDRQRCVQLYPALGRQFVQRRQLAVPIQYRFRHPPGQRRTVIEQDVRPVHVETQFGRDFAGEKGEAAGHQRRQCSPRSHGRNQFARARRQANAPPGFL